MLLLGWISHQFVIINDFIKVTVLCNKQGQIVLGVNASEGDDSRREEVFLKIQETEKSQYNNV